MSTQSSSINRVIKPPKNFKSLEISRFLNDCETIFSLRDFNERGFLLDLSDVKKVNMLGTLIIYKIIEYSAEHNCFHEPQINLPWKSEMGLALERYGFTELVLAFIHQEDVEKQYKSLKISTEGNFIIAPQALIRKDRQSRRDINGKYLPQIQAYYKNRPKAISMILLVFSEILLNFWEHAVDDSTSIIVAYGNKQYIEIACADTGNGIIATLGKSLTGENLRPEEILQKSVEKGTTSKLLTNHMGYGLWILDQITSQTKGRFHIYSQGAFYYNEYGVMKTGKCGFWQGTIVYIALSLENPKTLEDIEGDKLSSEIKVNWT